MSKANRLATSRIIEESGVDSLKELQAILKDPDFTLSETTLGSKPGQEAQTGFYVKDSVDWKGVTGIDAVREINRGVAGGLEQAIQISENNSGVTGTAIDPETGDVVTRKDLAQRGGNNMNRRRRAPQPEMESGEFQGRQAPQQG